MSIDGSGTRGRWTLGPDAFERLLAALNADRERAAIEYEQLRHRIIRLLRWLGRVALLSRETDALSAAAREKLANHIAPLGARLAGMVWKPLESRVRGKRLLIVADGVLQYVPLPPCRLPLAAAGSSLRVRKSGLGAGRGPRKSQVTRT
jgi:hypothetical protein